MGFFVELREGETPAEAAARGATERGVLKHDRKRFIWGTRFGAQAGSEVAAASQNGAWICCSVNVDGLRN